MDPLSSATTLHPLSTLVCVWSCPGTAYKPAGAPYNIPRKGPWPSLGFAFHSLCLDFTPSVLLKDHPPSHAKPLSLQVELTPAMCEPQARWVRAYNFIHQNWVWCLHQSQWDFAGTFVEEHLILSHWTWACEPLPAMLLPSQSITSLE